ncbi:HPF/RaiA family ribosome-associated protein [Winogradskyella poriferorum]|uniref:HPF/RaiA family ribosome-associated protein n=1 Tax=Winogradskyella poriferorum TaxID=307627 RepID=A0ABU7W5A3_9FLAO|tara:strand:- start:104 stop:406 length:303 start_codon:yes stop_codon:yes gene_type:complete
MKIIYEYHDVTKSDSLEDYTEKKLTKIFDRNEFVIRADVFFKTENTTSVDTGMIAGIRLSAPGPRLFAEASKSNFRDAVSECVEELQRQLSKRKETMKTY